MFIPPPPQQSSDPPRPNPTPLTNVFAETNNTLIRHSTPEFQLVLGEGLYNLRDELVLAIPPPHPTDIPVISNNPLEIAHRPVNFGSRLTTISAVERPTHTYVNGNGTSRRQSAWSAIGTPQPASHDQTDQNGKTTPQDPTASGPGDAGTSTKDSKEPKRRKPKTGIVKTTSSFLSRVLVADGLSKRLAERDANGIFAVTSLGRALQWLDLSSDQKVDYLTKLYFTKANVLCHDINVCTRSSTHLDVVAGFNTSDIVWYEPHSQKYTRLNKNGIVHPAPVVAVKWLPNSDNLFVAAHMDGTLIIYDKEKDDAAFVPSDPPARGTNSNNPVLTLDIKRSLEQGKALKANPVAVYQISWQAANAVAFSPSGRHLAVASEDGTLRIMDMEQEYVQDAYRSFYGGLTCVAWSPDGRYILTGGQDDLVSIWSLEDRALVARCQGHTAWVTDVKFDPWMCDDRGYRFGSVGEDCRLLLWDFSIGMLRKPRANSIHRGSVVSASLHHKVSSEWEADDPDVWHPVESRQTAAILPPIMVCSFQQGDVACTDEVDRQKE